VEVSKSYKRYCGVAVSNDPLASEIDPVCFCLDEQHSNSAGACCDVAWDEEDLTVGVGLTVGVELTAGEGLTVGVGLTVVLGRKGGTTVGVNRTEGMMEGLTVGEGLVGGSAVGEGLAVEVGLTLGFTV